MIPILFTPVGSGINTSIVSSHREDLSTSFSDNKKCLLGIDRLTNLKLGREWVIVDVNMTSYPPGKSQITDFCYQKGSPDDLMFR